MRGSGRSVVTSGFFDEHGTGGGERDLLPDAGVAVADGGEPVPADGGEEGGAVDGGDAAVRADAIAQGVFVRDAGMGLRRDEHGEHGLLAWLHVRGDVEDAADEGAASLADLGAVDPDVGGVVDAVKVEPDVVASVGLGNIDERAVPVRGVAEALGNDFGAIVFAVEGLGIDLVVDQRGEHRARNGGVVPTFSFES